MNDDLHDAVIIAMLEHPERAHEIAEWAADPDNLDGLEESSDDEPPGRVMEDHGEPPFPDAVFDETAHRWKKRVPGDDSDSVAHRRKKHGSGPPTDDAPRSRMGKLLARVGEVATAVKDKAAAFVKGTHDKLSAKYGPTGAKLVLGGMVALLPLPLPGSSLIPVAIAEGVKRIGGLFRSRAVESLESLPEGDALTTPEALAREILAAIAAAYQEMGEEPPAIDPDEARDVAEHLLAEQQ